MATGTSSKQPASGDQVGVGSARKRASELAPRVDAETLVAVGEHLEAFSAGLTAEEQTALSAVLKIGHRNPSLVALGAVPPEEILAPDELDTFRRLQATPESGGPGLKRYVVMVMKATRLCNLRCTYCRFWDEGPNQKMSFEVLARATQGVLSSPGVQAVDFCWHGGEVTLLPVAFYRKAIWLQEQFRRPGQLVSNSIQTNGTLLKPEWLDFLKRYRLSVGVSLDGPPEIHDQRRIDARGRATSARVRKGIELLRREGIAHGALMVVDDDVVALGAARMIEYFLDLGVKDVALLNVLPDNHPGRQAYFEFPRHVSFLRELFALWWPRYRQEIKFRELADLVGKVRGERGTLCVFDGNCMGGYLTIEPMGEIGACDKFLGDDDYRLGNVLTTPLAQIRDGHKFISVDASTALGIEGTETCSWFRVCQGGCPHDRYLRGRKGVLQDEACCGLGPLLDDIQQALERENDLGVFVGEPERPSSALATSSP